MLEVVARTYLMDVLQHDGIKIALPVSDGEMHPRHAADATDGPDRAPGRSSVGPRTRAESFRSSIQDWGRRPQPTEAV
jgi:hypothetical protein